MRLLFVLPDHFDPPTKGYQVRAARLASRLGDVVVVSSRTSASAGAHFGAERRPLSRALAALDLLRRGWPLQAALFDGADILARARRLVRDVRPDAVVVFTERLPLLVTALARDVPLVLDVVDALAGNMALRAQAQPARAPLWRREARAFRRAAPALARAAHAVVVTAERERELYPGATVIPVGVDVSTGSRPAPRWDVAFTGRLAYWPNALAARELCERIVPALRALLPDVRVVVAGAAPTAEVREACARAGVELLADVPDVGAVLRASRLAIAPVRHATGIQIKVIEALAAGTPAVVYPAVAAGLPGGLAGVVVADGPDAVAREAVAILRGERALTPSVAEAGSAAVAERFAAVVRSAIARA